jgi:hypothetical protein
MRAGYPPILDATEDDQNTEKFNGITLKMKKIKQFDLYLLIAIGWHKLLIL